MQNEKRTPLISIITPAYNSESFIEETMKSVLAQTYRHWEMIIVDDCSKDETVELVQTYMEQDERIKLIKLTENSGPAITRNTAINNAKGRFLAFLDSDDQWLPNKLEKQLQFMVDQQIAFSFSAYHVINEAGENTGTTIGVPDQVTYEELLKNNVIGCLTVMLDKEAIGDIEMVNIRTRQDYVLWLDLTKRGFTAYGLKEPLAKYRVVEQSISSNKIKMAKQNWYVYRKIEKIGLAKSIWYFIHYVYFKLKKYQA